MKRTLLLLAIAVFMLAGCVSNKAFKVEKEKINVLEARQNKQDTELEVIRKDILAEKEKMENLIIRMNGMDEQVARIEPIQAELDATGGDIAFLQDEVSGLKDGLADTVNKHASLEQRMTDQGAAVANEMDKMEQETRASIDDIRMEFEMLAEDTDFSFDAYTDNLAELRNDSKNFATKDELADVISENEKIATTLKELTGEVQEVGQGSLEKVSELESELKTKISTQVGVGEETIQAVSQRIDAVEVEIGLLREEQLAQNQAMQSEMADWNTMVKNDVAVLRQRVENLSTEVKDVTSNLEDVIATERAKKEKQRQLSITAQYKAALAAYNKRRYEESIVMFEDFLAQYPNEPLSPNAHYWIGENYYAGKKFSTAMEYFAYVRDNYPDHHKAMDAMLKVGMCYYYQDLKYQALEELNKLKEIYPKYSRMDLVNKYLRLTAN